MNRGIQCLLTVIVSFAAAFVLTRKAPSFAGQRAADAPARMQAGLQAHAEVIVASLLADPAVAKARAASLDAAQIKAALDTLYKTGRLDEKATAAGFTLLEAWAKTDPRAVVAWCRAHRFAFDARSLFQGLFEALAERDPSSLETLYHSLDGRHVRDAALRGILNAKEPADPRRKVALLKSLGDEGRTAANTLLRILAAEKPLEAVAIAAEETAFLPRLTARRAVIDGWSKTDPAMAMKWIRENLRPDGVTAMLIFNAARAAASVDPSGALKEAVKLPPGSFRQTMLSSVFLEWAGRQPAEAMAAAMNLEAGGERSAALASIAVSVSGKDLQTSSTLLEQAPSRTIQNLIVRETVSQQTAKNPQAMLEWVAQLPSTEHQKLGTGLAWQIWTEREPQAAADYATIHWDAPGSPEGHAAALHHLARKNPDDALTRLEALPPDRRSPAARSLLQSVGSLLEPGDHSRLQEMAK